MKAEILQPEEKIVPQCAIMGLFLLTASAVYFILQRYERSQSPPVVGADFYTQQLIKDLIGEIMELRDELASLRRQGAAVVLPAKPANGAEHEHETASDSTNGAT